MKKSVINERRLFDSPMPNEDPPFRKTKVLDLVSDEAGHSVVSSVCVEDEFFNRNIPLEYSEVSLSNLVAKGVEPHALDMIDSSKLGVDAGVEQLAQHLVNNTEKYVVTSKSE